MSTSSWMGPLERVCEALITDDNQLPRDAVQHLVAQKSADYDALLNTYAAGARFVLRNIERWRGRFHASRRRRSERQAHRANSSRASLTRSHAGPGADTVWLV